MDNRKAEFPLVVAVLWTESENKVQESLPAVGNALRELRERFSSGVVLLDSGALGDSSPISCAARDTGLEYRIIQRRGEPEMPLSIPCEGAICEADLEAIEACDVAVLVSRTGGSPESVRAAQARAYAKEIGRPVLEVGGGTGAPLDAQIHGLEIPADWLGDLFHIAGVSQTSDLSMIQKKMDALANRAAPVTRGWWKWIVLLEGIAIFIPLSWLVKRYLGLPVGGVASITFFSAVLLVTMSWWLRWRGMQKIWARARLVAEVTRSMLATIDCPRTPAWQILRAAPALRHLRWLLQPPSSAAAFDNWRKRYLTDRIQSQEDYFKTKYEEAQKQRKDLSAWTTLLLDVTLALGAASMVCFLIPKFRDWSRIFGGERLEIVLGIAGVSLPVCILLLRALSTLHELNRRAARFAQQGEMLRGAKARLSAVQSAEPGMKIAEDIERELLAEVVEWYFHAECAEHFFEFGKTRGSAQGLKIKTAAAPGRFRFALNASSRLRLATLYTLRVVLGRAPWVVCSAAAALGWLAYNEPKMSALSELTPLARVFDRRGEPWEPSVERGEHGCVIIVHGLHDGVQDTNGTPSWMKKTAIAIETRMGDAAPNIALVDWKDAATPAKLHGLEMPGADFALDLAGIRNQGKAVGQLLAYRLASMLLDGSIRKDRPLEFIGHSAGGFVITDAALLLKKLNLAPEMTHLTILDTPEPDDDLLYQLPAAFPGAVDFYVTSRFVRRDLDFSHLRMKPEPPPAGTGLLESHSYAHEWFIESISKPQAGEGFERSPLLKPPGSGG